MKAIFLSMLILLMMNMQAQKKYNPPSLFDPAPYGFSHVATVPAGYQLVLVAGQGGEENTEGKLTPDFRTQVRQALLNIQKALAPEKLTMDDVVKVTSLVVDHDEQRLQILIEEFKRVWPQKNFPINTLIPVPRLAITGMLFELEAMAVKKPK